MKHNECAQSKLISRKTDSTSTNLPFTRRCCTENWHHIAKGVQYSSLPVMSKQTRKKVLHATDDATAKKKTRRHTSSANVSKQNEQSDPVGFRPVSPALCHPVLEEVHAYLPFLSNRMSMVLRQGQRLVRIIPLCLSDTGS